MKTEWQPVTKCKEERLADGGDVEARIWDQRRKWCGGSAGMAEEERTTVGGTEGPLREKKSKGVKLKEKLKQEEEDGCLRGKNRSNGMEMKGDGTVKKYQGRKLCGPPKRGCSMS